MLSSKFTTEKHNLHKNTIFIFSIISFFAFIAFLISLIVSYSVSHFQNINSSPETHSAFFTNLGAIWIFMIFQTKSFDELKIKRNYFNLIVISIIYFIFLLIGFALLTYSLLINNPVSFYITEIIQLTFWMALFIYSYSLNKKKEW